MSKRLKQRAAITQVLCGHLLENGLQQTSLRQLAKAAGVSDRMLLYYFKNKADVLAEVMQAIAVRFTYQLDQALPESESRAAHQLFRIVADLSNRPDVQPFMQIWMEAITLAGRGLEPYRTVARQIAAGFLSWIEARLPDGPLKQADAILLLTMIEGLSVMAVCTDDETYASAHASMIQLLQREN